MVKPRRASWAGPSRMGVHRPASVRVRRDQVTGRRRAVTIAVALLMLALSSCAESLDDGQRARLTAASGSTSISALRSGAGFGRLVTTEWDDSDVRAISRAVRRAHGSSVLLEDLLVYLERHPKATVIEPLRTSVATLVAGNMARFQSARLANEFALSHGKAWEGLVRQMGENRSAAEQVGRSLSIAGLTELRAAVHRYASRRGAATALDGLDGGLYLLSLATAQTAALLQRGGFRGDARSEPLDPEQLRSSGPIDSRAVPPMPSARLLKSALSVLSTDGSGRRIIDEPTVVDLGLSIDQGWQAGREQ